MKLTFKMPKITRPKVSEIYNSDRGLINDITRHTYFASIFPLHIQFRPDDPRR